MASPLNLRSGQEVTTRAEKMNSAATADHLEHVLATYPDVPFATLCVIVPRGMVVLQCTIVEANPRLESHALPDRISRPEPSRNGLKATRSAISHNHDLLQMELLADRFEDHLVSNKFCYSMLKSTIMADYVPCLIDFSIRVFQQ